MDQDLYIKEINGIKKNIINHPLFKMKFNKKQLSVFMSAQKRIYKLTEAWVLHGNLIVIFTIEDVVNWLQI